ncbi:MAG: hypothetical protein JWL83_3293 [Actinomycetia bacterium]|nr:hypothetical protein [Actinomycetes bacterium]
MSIFATVASLGRSLARSKSDVAVPARHSGHRAPVLAQIEVKGDGDAVAISIAGELDLVDRDAFAALLRQVRAGHPARIEIDLAHVDFLGVPLIRVLEQQRRESDSQVVVTNAHGAVKRVLDLVDFDYEG